MEILGWIWGMYGLVVVLNGKIYYPIIVLSYNMFGKARCYKSRENSKQVTCWFCKKESHLRKNCPSRQKDYKQENINLSYGYKNEEGLTILEDLA